MPPAASILDSLAEIANGLQGVAVIWHGFVGAALIAMFGGWRPSHRLLAGLLVLPVGSVSASAFISENPFNGASFGMLALLLAVLARHFPHHRVRSSEWPSMTTGTTLIGLGLVYPHFLLADSWVAYLYAAPFALIPCPTLMVVIGATLVFGNFGSIGWRMVLATAGVLYGAIGVIRLGVWIDWPLLAGAVVLAGSAAGRAWPAQTVITRIFMRNQEVRT